MEINKEKIDISGQTLSPEKQIRIKPVSDIDVGKANFIFDKFQRIKAEFDAAKEVYKYYDEIFNCKEEDFKFDYLDIPSEQLSDFAEKFDEERWGKLTIEEKKFIVECTVYSVCKSLGIEYTPIVVYYNAFQSDCGGYNFKENIMSFNESNLDNPKLIFNVISHESWHAYQKMHAFNPETQKDVLYLLNFKYYVSPQKIDDKWVNFDSYEKQLLEAEARAFAKEMMGKVGM